MSGEIEKVFSEVLMDHATIAVFITTNREAVKVLFAQILTKILERSGTGKRSY